MTNQPAQLGALDGLGRRGRTGRGLAKARARRGERRTRRRRRRLVEGRIKAKPSKKAAAQPVHIRRLTPDGKLLPCLPHRESTVRCYRRHAENDPAIGQPIEARKPSRNATGEAAGLSRSKLAPGLEPKTVVNAHRMLHRAWEDFSVWGGQNGISSMTRIRPESRARVARVWNVTQLRTFLQRTRSDRFFALWVLEATSGMRRCELAGARRELLDLAAGTLTIETTRVVVDGKVIESDGKTKNAQHALALDPFTLAVLRVHVEMLDQERRDFGPGYHEHGVLFCWENGTPPHPDTITRRFKRLAAAAGLPEIDLHDVRHSYATAGRDAKIDWKALSQRIGHADVAFTMQQYVQTDLQADREVANTLADLIIGGLLITDLVDDDAEADDQGNESAAAAR
jgi:integrase